MSTKGDRDAAIDRLLRTSLGAGSDGGDCPSADVLAAFVEGSLAARERQAAEAHLATCRRCHEALAALADMAGVLPARDVRRPQPWLGLRWLVPAATLLTLLIVYFAIRPPFGHPPAPAQTPVMDRSPAAEKNEANAPQGGQAASVVARAETAPATPAAKPKPEARLGALQPLRTAPPSNVVAQNAPRSGSGAAAFLAPRAAAKGVAAAPPSPAAADAKLAAPSAAPQAAAQSAPPAAPPLVEQVNVAGAAAKVADGKPVAAPTIASATPPAEAKAQRVDTLAESVEIREGSGFVVTSRDGRARWRVDARGAISRSVDNGVTWQPAQTAAVGLLAGSSPSATVAWVVGRAGMVLRTTDGEHWTACPFPEKVDLVSVDANDDRTATATARDGRRFATIDGGATWTLVQ